MTTHHLGAMPLVAGLPKPDELTIVLWRYGVEVAHLAVIEVKPPPTSDGQGTAISAATEDISGPLEAELWRGGEPFAGRHRLVAGTSAGGHVEMLFKI